jgi:hypothetical protein
MAEKLGIDYFGKNRPLAKLHGKTTLQMRRKMYDFLENAVDGVRGKKFLDHGSTPETTRQASNCLIRWLLEDDAKVYACSPEEISHLAAFFPGLLVLDWPPTPSQVEGIDYIISSAVIEHVGNEQSQIEYVSSLLRLCPRLFITTPNRYHWLEFHTRLPLLHWLPRSWHRAVLNLIGMKFWAREKNLRLLAEDEFARIIEQAARINGLKVTLHWYKPKFLGLVSNLCVLVH